LQEVAPGVGQFLLSDAHLDNSEKTDNGEVYLSLPTAFNSKNLARSLNSCAEELHEFSRSSPLPKSVRAFLTKTELCAVLASTYNLIDTECLAWDSLLAASEKSGRFLDASYALTNRLMAKLLATEANASSHSQLSSCVLMLTSELAQRKPLLDATYEAALTGQLPNRHAHLQAVMVGIFKAYLENYFNWAGFSAAMDLIPLRYKDFLEEKSWAAVCARGYYYWLHLHARCIFGAFSDASLGESGDTTAAELSPPITPPPESPLHAAVIVRMHGRTLVQFIRQCCEQKLSKKRILMKDSEKENVCPASRQPISEKQSGGQGGEEGESQLSTHRSTIWSCSGLGDGELLNLWLATRLLVRGCTQVTELYTLLGSVREARAYQDELLRVGQRFHLCDCTQTALSLMAYVDMFAQRKWAFELRLRQLCHIASSQISLEEIVKKTKFSLPMRTGEHTADDKDEAEFLRTSDVPSLCRDLRSLDAQDEDADADSLSAGANPLLAANVNAFAAIFPCSPDRSSRSRPKNLNDMPTQCFPDSKQLLSAVSGQSTVPDRSSLSDGNPTDTMNNKSHKFFQIDHELIAAGGVSLFTCVDRILNGVIWPWLTETTRLVRDTLLTETHYLPALLQQENSCTYMKTKSEISVNKDLIEAFSALTTSPERTTRKASSTFGITPNENSMKNSDSKALCTGHTMLPPPPAPNAPCRVYSRSSRPTRSLRKTRKTGTSESNRPVDAPLVDVGSTPRRLRIRSTDTRKSPVCENYGRPAVSDVEGDVKDKFSWPLVSRGFAVRERPVLGDEMLNFYVDSKQTRCCSPSRRSRSSRVSRPKVELSTSTTKHSSNSVYSLDPIESCPLLAGVARRPRNLRWASKWEAVQQRTVHVPHDLCLSEAEISLSTDADYAQMLRIAESSADALTTHLNSAYSKLLYLPIPNLFRPICHWLGLRWLSKGDQVQAGRYLAQSVGIAATSLYMSILSSRLAEVKSSHKTSSSPDQLNAWRRGFNKAREFICGRTQPFAQSVDRSFSTNSSRSFVIVQLCVVDELGAYVSRSSDSSLLREECPHVPLGLGARSNGYLIITRYAGVVGDSLSQMRSETRVFHGFSDGGLKALDTFDELQMESLDSMQLQDRVQYWKARYKLDAKLKSILKEMREDWFTKDDLKWILGLSSSSPPSEMYSSIVLVPDRRLAYLPWEWILWDQSDSPAPTFTRSFSVPLVLGQLASQSYSDAPPTNKSALPPRPFNPRDTFYVLNPESNLAFTQETFQPLFSGFPGWHGVTGRMPTSEEVNSGFTEHDLFVYLGHGNGSRFLLQTFNQGLSARATALVLGCSSGKPRWEGRHEPYSSLFNHIIAGCPFVAGLLWDVTDRDVDRFTLQFLSRWLCRVHPSRGELRVNADDEAKNPSSPKQNKRPQFNNLGSCLFQAASACKLKHLVGKSVIVYGIAAEPLKESFFASPRNP
ncbi:unnamed protein product, partial [Calicophoron daubneyi]